MTAQLFNLAIERNKRAKPAPTGTPCDSYRITMLKRSDHWAFQIALDDTGEEWHSERPYATEDDAWSEALLAVRQVRRERRLASSRQFRNQRHRRPHSPDRQQHTQPST